MKHLVRNALVTVLGIGLVGCEWSGGGSGSGWDSRFNFVNFSGNYRGAGAGGLLVSEFTGVIVSSGSGASSSVSITGENDGTAPALQQVISGQLAKTPVQAGSVTILFGSLGSFRDKGDGTISGNYEQVSKAGVTYTGSGTIDYNTGVWSITLATATPFTVAQSITVSYVFTPSATSGSSSGSAEPGSSGITLYVFDVQQEGNKIKIIDNNGSVYDGEFGSIRTTGGTDQNTANPTFIVGDQIIGQFEASGKSAAGLNVKLVGSFQTVIASVDTSGTTTTMSLGDRRILGTWIEDGGKTGDINGLADSVSVSTTTATSTTTTNRP